MARIGSETSDLTHSQTQIWIGQRLHPESPLYNMAFAFVVPTELRADLFREAWRRVADGSDVLRTRLEEHEGAAVRRISEAGSCLTEVVELPESADPEKEFLAWCRRTLRSTTRPRRRLSSTAPWFLSATVEPGGTSISTTWWPMPGRRCFCIAGSARSMQRCLAETMANAHRAPTTIRPLRPCSRRPLHRRLRPNTGRLDRERSGRSVPLYGRSSDPTGTASTRVTLELDEKRSRALDELSQQDGFLSLSQELSRFTVFATLLVSWLHRVSGNHDLGFDAPVAGRPTAEAKRTLGLFIEMFPFAASVDPDDTFRSLGARCLEEAKLFLRHALPGTSTPSSVEASNIVLNFFPAAFGQFAGLPVRAEWIHPGHGDSVHALRLQVHDFSGSGRYVLHFDFNEGSLPERLRHRSLEHFEKLLDACVDDPDQPIASVDVLVEDERRALASLNSTDSSRSSGSIGRRAFRRAGRSAIPTPWHFDRGTLEMSFASLQEQSEAVAADLVATRPPTGRSGCDFQPAFDTSRHRASLASLKARGAYVPIDPSSPGARWTRSSTTQAPGSCLSERDLQPTTSTPDVSVAQDR